MICDVETVTLIISSNVGLVLANQLGRYIVF